MQLLNTFLKQGALDQTTHKVQVAFICLFQVLLYLVCVHALPMMVLHEGHPRFHYRQLLLLCFLKLAEEEFRYFRRDISLQEPEIAVLRIMFVVFIQMEHR